MTRPDDADPRIEADGGVGDTVAPQDLQVLSDEDGDRFVVIGTIDTETAWLAVQAQFVRDGVDADNWGEPNRYETGRDWVWRHDGEDGDRWLERRPPLSINPAFAATVVIFI